MKKTFFSFVSLLIGAFLIIGCSAEDSPLGAGGYDSEKTVETRTIQEGTSSIFYYPIIVPTATPTDTNSSGGTYIFQIAKYPDRGTLTLGINYSLYTPNDGYVGEDNYKIKAINTEYGTSVTYTVPLVITAVNNAPTIEGAPTTNVELGQDYFFKPFVNDRDSNNLEYSIAGKPIWASFDTSTGVLSGKVTGKGDGYVYPNIIISVNDGEFFASLEPFSITVGTAPAQ